jgi:hypothetical protein
MQPTLCRMCKYLDLCSTCEAAIGKCACVVQSSGEGLSGESGDGAACLDWVLSDAGLTAAIANCTATEAVCRVVPLGALPCGSVRSHLNKVPDNPPFYIVLECTLFGMLGLWRATGNTLLNS